ncbi:MAG: hypothetical protein M3Z35_17900, partial [Nitrospirota bacterium]|nr:hypothetical protein [Nitrospirota bacterium]
SSTGTSAHATFKEHIHTISRKGTVPADLRQTGDLESFCMALLDVGLNRPHSDMIIVNIETGSFKSLRSAVCGTKTCTLRTNLNELPNAI